MLFDLIDAIYDAALAPEQWPAVLSRITSVLGAPCTTIVPFHKPSAVVVSPGLEEGHSVYARHWWKYDLITQTAARSPRLGLILDWDLLTPEDIARSPFYQDFRRPLGMGFCLSFLSRLSSNDVCSFSVHLPSSLREPPNAEAIRQFSILGQHVGRAFSITQRTASLLSGEQAFTELLSRLPYGVALVDESGRVILANAALDALAQAGLKVVCKALRAAHASEQPKLDRLIHGAILQPSVGSDCDTVMLTRPGRRWPLMVTGIPLAKRHQTRAHESGLPLCRALIIAVDLESEKVGRIEEKLDLLQLTPAEARLAALVGVGRSPREAAEALGIAESTARSSLKQIFGKLAISRQSELARLLARLSAIVSV